MLVADQPLHEPGAAVPGDDAQIQEGFAELGLFRSDADVGHVRQVEACTYGRAVHRGDDRYLHLLQGQRNPLDAVAIALGAFGDTAREIATAFGHVLDVAAG